MRSEFSIFRHFTYAVETETSNIPRAYLLFWHPNKKKKTNMAEQEKGCTCPSKLAKTVNVSPKSFLSIYRQLTVVDRSVKTAWLCDVCYISLKEMKEIISVLKQEGYLTRELSVIQINTDILVIDVELFYQKLVYLTNELDKGINPPSDIKFIILKEGCIPSLKLSSCLKQKLVYNLKSVLAQINENRNPMYLCIKLRDNELTPTIFGIALEYPVVYLIEDDEYSVQVLDLSVICLKLDLDSLPRCILEYHNSSYDLVTSFSVPADLVNNCDEAILMWKDSVLNRSVKTGLSLKVSFEKVFQKSVTL